MLDEVTKLFPDGLSKFCLVYKSNLGLKMVAKWKKIFWSHATQISDRNLIQKLENMA